MNMDAALMTRDEFIDFAHGMTNDESIAILAEQIAEHNGVVALYGDAGPGSARRLHSELADLRSIERQLARLERREPREFFLRIRGAR
jgi:hypothetical protein